jgi:hypothetical protein
MQLTMRKFDVKKNSFLRKDLIEPVGKPNPLLPGGCLKEVKNNICLQKQFKIL